MSAKPIASTTQMMTIAVIWLPTTAVTDVKSMTCSQGHAVSDCMWWILKVEAATLTGPRAIRGLGAHTYGWHLSLRPLQLHPHRAEFAELIVQSVGYRAAGNRRTDPVQD